MTLPVPQNGLECVGDVIHYDVFIEWHTDNAGKVSWGWKITPKVSSIGRLGYDDRESAVRAAFDAAERLRAELTAE